MSPEESPRLLSLFLASSSLPPESFIIDTAGYSHEGKGVLYILYVYPLSHCLYLSSALLPRARLSEGALIRVAK